MNIHKNTIFLFSSRVDDSPCEELSKNRWLKPVPKTSSIHVARWLWL